MTYDIPITIITIGTMYWSSLCRQFTLIFPLLESDIFMSRKLRCGGYRNKIKYEKKQRFFSVANENFSSFLYVFLLQCPHSLHFDIY